MAKPNVKGQIILYFIHYLEELGSHMANNTDTERAEELKTLLQFTTLVKCKLGKLFYSTSVKVLIAN